MIQTILSYLFEHLKYPAGITVGGLIVHRIYNLVMLMMVKDKFKDIDLKNGKFKR